MKNTGLEPDSRAYIFSKYAPGVFTLKKKIWELGMTVLLLTGVFWLARTGARLTGADAGAGNGVVLIDSGHGGSDP